MTALLTDAELAALRDIAVTLADDSPFNAERLLRLLDEHAALREWAGRMVEVVRGEPLSDSQVEDAIARILRGES